MSSRRPEVLSTTKNKKGKDMGRKRKAQYKDELCKKMYAFFLEYDDRGLPSFEKFAISLRLTMDDVERFRKHPKFESAYRECKEIRRDYLIDRALDRRFDPSFVKFLLSSEAEEESCESGELTLRLLVTE